MKNRMPEAIVAGAGGHGKVVVSLLQELGYSVITLLDDDRSKWGSCILSVPVEGPLEKLREIACSGTILAFGSNRTRLDLAEKYQGVTWLSAVHPYSWVHPSVKIGDGSVVFAGSIIQPDTVIGRHCIINTGVTIDHDCQIGDGIHIAPGCHLAGNITIEEGSFLGVGVSVIPGCTIGKGTIVGAGATVITDLPEMVVAVGTPARPVRSSMQEKKEG